MSPHLCPVAGCGDLCAPAKLMCWRHWRTVPPDLQLAVYRTYRTYYGTAVLPVDRLAQANRDRLDAARAAIAAASASENQTQGEEPGERSPE